MRLFRAVMAATCAVVLAVGCRNVLGIHDFDGGDANVDGASDAPEDAVCEASIEPDSGLLDDVVQLALGNGFSCALQTSGAVWCWGLNDLGQIGPNGGASSLKPVQVPVNAKRISAGTDFVCALTTDNWVKCWGNDDVRQLGQDSGTGVVTAGIAQKPFIGLSSSHEHTCAIEGTHEVWCFGANDQQQSGQSALTDAGSLPTTLPHAHVQPATSLVAAGAHHACFVDDDLVYCWGANDVAQFGLPANATPTLAIQGVSFGNGVVDLQANSNDTCALLDSGHIFCSGSNQSDQIGSTDATTPTEIEIYDEAGPPPFVAFAIADDHSCFVIADGNVACVGVHSQGQLGNNVVADGSSDFAQYVLDTDGGVRLDGVIGVAVAGTVLGGSQNSAQKQQFHSCAIVRSGCGASGRVACWGGNLHGQLGIGTSDGGPHAIPVWVVAP